MQNVKIKIKKVIVLILVNFVFAGRVCGYDYGRTQGQILDMYTSARIMAMGNAGAGLANDLNALVYNPAGLAQLQKIQVQATHIFYFVKTGMDAVSYGQKIGNVGFGIKWKYFYAGDTIRDESGEEGESFDIIYSQYSVGAGCPVTKRFSAGFAVNIVSEQVCTEKDSFTGVDLGWHYNFSTKKHLRKIMLRDRGRIIRRVVYRQEPGINSVGLVIKNLGVSELPLKLVLGGGHRIPFIKNLIVVWEGFIDRRRNYGYKFGVEGEMRGFKARAGFIYKTNPNITFGFGVPQGKWRIDYAFFYHWDLGMAHRITVGIDF